MTIKAFEINLLAIHWLPGCVEADDLCAHGEVRVRVGEEPIMDIEAAPSHWTLSAMALHLLRTLDRDHLPSAKVGEHLVPCCGYDFFYREEKGIVDVPGCETGVNYWVKHEAGQVVLETEGGQRQTLPFDAYKSEVLAFVDEVERFYQSSLPKHPIPNDYERLGYEMFWREWKALRGKWA
jgi:hypothetical protein